MNSLRTRINEMFEEYRAISNIFGYMRNKDVDVGEVKKSVNTTENNSVSFDDKAYLANILKLNPNLVFDLLYNSNQVERRFRNVSLEFKVIDDVITPLIQNNAILFKGIDKITCDEKFDYHYIVVNATYLSNQVSADIAQSEIHQKFIIEFKLSKVKGKKYN
jgi:hypothetical protein